MAWTLLFCMALVAAVSEASCPGLRNCVSKFEGPYSSLLRLGLANSGIVASLDTICEDPENKKMGICKDEELRGCTNEATKTSVKGAVAIFDYFCSPDGRATLQNAEKSSCAGSVYTVPTIQDKVNKCENRIERDPNPPESDSTNNDNSESCRRDRAKAQCFNEVMEKCGDDFSNLWSQISVIMEQPLDKSQNVKPRCQ